MEKREKQLIRTSAVMAMLFLTFGITYLDFENPGIKNNIRPYLEILVGLILGGYLGYLKMQKTP